MSRSEHDHDHDHDHGSDDEHASAAPYATGGGHTPIRGDDEAPGEHDVARLRPEDQARVDAFLRRGVNSVERKPFRPILLVIVLIAVVAGLSLFSQWLARSAGVY